MTTKVHTKTGRSDRVKQQLEAQFDNHDVEVYIITEKYDNAADWGVVCQDCGISNKFFITANDGLARISDVYVDAIEEKPCKPYEVGIPDDLDCGDHTLNIEPEDPSGATPTRPAHCSNCRRHTELPRYPKYIDQGIGGLSDFPCQETYTDRELAGAVLYPSLNYYPDQDAVGIGRWQYEGNPSYGYAISGYFWHPEIPVTVVKRSDKNGRWIEFNLVPGRLSRGKGSRSPGCGFHSDTLFEVKYQNGANYDDEYPVDHETVVNILAFMVATNGMGEDAWEAASSRHKDPIATLIEQTAVDRTVR